MWFLQFAAGLHFSNSEAADLQDEAVDFSVEESSQLPAAFDASRRDLSVYSGVLSAPPDRWL